MKTLWVICLLVLFAVSNTASAGVVNPHSHKRTAGEVEPETTLEQEDDSMYSSSDYEPVLSTKEMLVSANAIKHVVFNLFNSFGRIHGYLIFQDKYGRMCATNGILTISKEYEVISENQTFGGKAIERETKTKHIKNMNFNPDDFKQIELRNKDKIFALPIILDVTRVESGDIIKVSWYGFDLKKRVP